jgi:hypothetical protein
VPREVQGTLTFRNWTEVPREAQGTLTVRNWIEARQGVCWETLSEMSTDLKKKKTGATSKSLRMSGAITSVLPICLHRVTRDKFTFFSPPPPNSMYSKVDMEQIPY